MTAKSELGMRNGTSFRRREPSEAMRGSADQD
jgi:hypothetical protein